MKIDLLHDRDLLKYYIEKEYPKKKLLIIHNSFDDNNECNLHKIQEELRFFFSLQVEGIIITYDYLIVEADLNLARRIIDKYHKSDLYIEYWANGECIDENL